jgi:uncharacterized protein (DUF2062 family)
LSFRDKLRLIFTIKGSPREIAIAFAVGIFIGFSPLLGLHTVLAISIASLFRMNKLVTMIGTYVVNPWTIIPVYTFCTWVGIKMVDSEAALSRINFHEINLVNIFRTLKELIIPFVVGTLTLGIMAAILSFAFLYYLLLRVKRDDDD